MKVKKKPKHWIMTKQFQLIIIQRLGFAFLAVTIPNYSVGCSFLTTRSM
jgi:hypothetical protein